MKKILLLLLVAFSINAFSQATLTEYTMLDGWTFDKDTTVYLTTGYDYKMGIQIEATSLTGTIDGVIRIKRKIKGFTKYCHYSEDSTDSRKVIDDAGYYWLFHSKHTVGDTLQIELIQNNITGGTLLLKAKMFKNR